MPWYKGVFIPNYTGKGATAKLGKAVGKIDAKKPKNFKLYGLDMKGEYAMKRKRVGPKKKGLRVTGVKRKNGSGGG